MNTNLVLLDGVEGVKGERSFSLITNWWFGGFEFLSYENGEWSFS